jgi:hypothetical protein
MVLNLIQQVNAWLAMVNIIVLKGNSSQRRKQLRAFKRKYKYVEACHWGTTNYCINQYSGWD